MFHYSAQVTCKTCKTDPRLPAWLCHNTMTDCITPTRCKLNILRTEQVRSDTMCAQHLETIYT